MEKKKIIKIILIVVFLLILVDQLSKVLIDKLVTNDIIILQNVLTISKTENSDFTLGLNKQSITNIFLMILILVVVIRFVVIQKHNLQKSTAIFLGMIIAGMISNLLDIIFKGAVLDFIIIGDFSAINLADCLVVVGWVLFIIDLFKRIRDVS